MLQNPNHRQRGRPKFRVDPSPDGSASLAAPRRELFACYASRLSNLTDAYIAAGYTCANRGVASRNGSRLRSRELGVRERIVFLAELDDDEFEQAFEGAKARVAALEQAELGIGSNALLTSHKRSTGDSGIEPDAPEKGAPDSRAELVGTRDVLEYVVRMSRMLNERAKQLELGANIRKRVLSLHGAATIRLLEKLDRLILADKITAETERKRREIATNTLAADVSRVLTELRNSPCTCGGSHVA